jgi:hypothetical protein
MPLPSSFSRRTAAGSVRGCGRVIPNLAAPERPHHLYVQRMRHSAAKGDTSMTVRNAPTPKGKEAARGLEKAAAKNERETEADMGRPLKKGEKRFEERSKSSDGKSAGEKQR